MTQKQKWLHAGIVVLILSLSLFSVFLIDRSFRYRGKKAIAIKHFILENSPLKTTNLQAPFNLLFSSSSDRDLKPMRLKATFIYNKASFKNPVLFIPFMDCNALSAYLNGTKIGTAGNPIDGNSSMWNHSELFFIPKDLLKNGTNTMSLKIITHSALAMIFPVYIASARHVIPYIFKSNFLSNTLVSLSIGFMILLGLIFISIGIYLKQQALGRFFIGISLILLGFYLFDYYYFQVLPIHYAVFKKYVMFFFYTSLAFLSLGYSTEFKKIPRFSKMTAALLALAALTMLFLPNDTVLIKDLYHKLNYLVFLFLIDIVVIAGLNVKTRRDTFSYIQFYLILFILPFFFHDIYGIIHNLNITLFTPIAIIIFYLTSAGLLIYSFMDIHRQMLIERKRAVMMEKENFLDELTGIFNRKIIRQIRDLIPIYYSVALIDIDDFKQINNTYGHSAGDYVLITFANLIKHAIRSTDYVIRYGGDEFLLLLFDCNLTVAHQILQDLKKALEKHEFHYKGKQIKETILCSVGIVSKGRYSHYLDLFQALDELLYNAKKQGKGQIIFSKPVF